MKLFYDSVKLVFFFKTENHDWMEVGKGTNFDHAEIYNWAV